MNRWPQQIFTRSKSPPFTTSVAEHRLRMEEYRLRMEEVQRREAAETVAATEAQRRQAAEAELERLRPQLANRQDNDI